MVSQCFPALGTALQLQDQLTVLWHFTPARNMQASSPHTHSRQQTLPWDAPWLLAHSLFYSGSSLLGFISNVRGNSKVPAIGLLQNGLWQKTARIWEGQAEAKRPLKVPKPLTAREKPETHIAGGGPQV